MMITLSVILSILAAFADSHSTYTGLMNNRRELNPLRRSLIRILGRRGGTYGIAVAWAALVIGVNFWSNQPTWSLVVGNLSSAAIFAYAAVKNLD